jgi:hypothetical protein
MIEYWFLTNETPLKTEALNDAARLGWILHTYHPIVLAGEQSRFHYIFTRELKEKLKSK